MWYRLAKLNLQMSGAAGNILDNTWKPFACKAVQFPEMVLRLTHPISLDYQVEHFVAPDYCQIFRYEADILLANRDFSVSALLPLRNPDNLTVFSNHVFYSNAVRRQMLQFHAATIEDEGRGILFLGPSGIGKTTQAERWAQFRGSTIINGDIGFVQRTTEGYLAWGTPWHGSSPYCLNASAPLKALVVLKQAPCNTLRELTGFEKVSEVSSHVFYPTWLEDGMDLCSDTLNHLLSDLPVYRLDNRADEEAVALLAKELEHIS